MKAKPWWQVGSSSALSSESRSAIDLSIPATPSKADRPRTQREFRLVEHQEHQDAIRQVANDAEANRIFVRLVRVQNRIRITTLTGAALGFFSRKDAEMYAGVLASIARQFTEIRCAATVEVDWNGELFVTLDIASPTQCAAMAG